MLLSFLNCKFPITCITCHCECPGWPTLVSYEVVNKMDASVVGSFVEMSFKEFVSVIPTNFVFLRACNTRGGGKSLMINLCPKPSPGQVQTECNSSSSGGYSAVFYPVLGTMLSLGESPCECKDMMAYKCCTALCSSARGSFEKIMQ